MPIKHHNHVAHQWQDRCSSPLKSTQTRYRELLVNKMSEPNTSTNNLIGGMSAYENFRAGDNVVPINSPKLPSFDQLRSRQMNGADSPLTPTSPVAWQDNQQIVQSLRQELEEKKRNEEQLQQIITAMKQNQFALNGGHFDHGNGPSLTPDGLPAAPSSDGILESVKDGHIKRLGRELTMLKAKLHETEARCSTAMKERDSVFQQVASLSSLLADSDRRAANLQQQLSAMASAGGADKLSNLNNTLEKQKAEISTLKESVQRLSRENQSLKESAAGLSSRQPSSLGNGGGSSSVAGCSQELDYLHKVVDTLKATVQEQHAKLICLRSMQDKPSPTSSTMSGYVRAQSFPVTSRSSSGSQGASASMRRPGNRGAAVTMDRSNCTVDGAGGGQTQEGLPRSTAAVVPSTASSSTTTFALSGVLNNNTNNLGGSGHVAASNTRSNQAVQDDETVFTLGNVMQKMKLSDTKPIPGLGSGGVGTEANRCREDGIEGVDNPGYFVAAAPQNIYMLSSETNFNMAQSHGSAASALNPAGVVGNSNKLQSQAIASRRSDFPSPVSALPVSSSGTRPQSKSEVIGVSSGPVRPSISRSSSARISSSGTLSKGEASAEDLLAILSGKSDPLVKNPIAPASSSVAGGLDSSNLLPSRFPLVQRMPGAGPSPGALQMSSREQPQFVFESEVAEGCTPLAAAASGLGRTDFQQQPQHRIPGFTPQPPPNVHQVSTSSSASPLSTYQTASAAVTSNRDGVIVLNKHMMGGGNVIYQQLLVQPEQMRYDGVGSPLFPNSQNFTFTPKAFSPHGNQLPQQQQQLAYGAKISAPLGNQQQGDEQALYINTSPQEQSQHLDPSGPRVHSDRACPVCGQDFSHVPMENFQAHVYECFDEAGPETMKAHSEDKSAGNAGGGGAAVISDRTCPVCNARFELSVPQTEFERHVHSHFGEENFEIVS